ncbi:RING finger protein 44, partial [Mucuna pruriens]
MSLKGLVSIVINLIGLAEGPRSNDVPLPSYMISSESAASNFNEDSWCCVCLSRLKAKDEIRVLPCSHKFHKICVNRWLKGRHKTCPLCRFSMGPQDKSHRAEMFTEEMLIWFSSFHVADPTITSLVSELSKWVKKLTSTKLSSFT